MNPWDYATTVYFEAGTKVRIGDVNNPNSSFTFGALEGATGTIGGIAFDHVIKTYIVVLDKPLETPWLPVKTHTAVVIPAGHLRPVVEQVDSNCNHEGPHHNCDLPKNHEGAHKAYRSWGKLSWKNAK